jgi:heme exporter protein A
MNHARLLRTDCFIAGQTARPRSDLFVCPDSTIYLTAINCSEIGARSLYRKRRALCVIALVVYTVAVFSDRLCIMPPPAALDITGLSCVRGDRTLFRDLDMAAYPGEVIYVRGRNGCGKTTLLRALAGLLLPESGQIRWQGEPIRSLREDYARHLLYLGHLNAIKGDLTAVENLRIAATLDGYALDEERAWQVLATIGLRGYEDLPSKHLSQGQKRRVALARLLANDATLWILDEPFTALDVAAVDQLQQVIRNHVDAGGIAILTTHQEVAMLSDRARVLDLGKAHA